MYVWVMLIMASCTKELEHDAVTLIQPSVIAYLGFY